MNMTIHHQRALQTALLLAGCAAPLASHAISAPREDVAAFLGTTVTAIESINPDTGGGELGTTRGVAVRRSFAVSAGDTISFDWFFGTDEGDRGASNRYVDFALMSINGALSLLSDSSRPLERADITSPFIEQLLPLGSGSDAASYFRTHDIVADTSGVLEIAFAVMDVRDTVVETGLVLDNFRLNGSLVVNGGFEDYETVGATTSFASWETLGDVGPWDSLPGTTEGLVGAALISGNFDPPAVPLPPAAWLLGSALAALGWRRRRG